MHDVTFRDWIKKRPYLMQYILYGPIIYMMFIHTLIIMVESPSICNIDIDSDFASSNPKSQTKTSVLLLVHIGRGDDFTAITLKYLMTMP